MNRIYHHFAKKVGTTFLFCFFIILHGSGVSEAKFLDQEDANKRPRFRMGSYPSSTLGTTFLGPEHLGQHGYRYSQSERKGIVYTCEAGHIDIAHLRKCADWTAYLAAKTLKQLMNNETEFSFKLYEPSVYFVKLTYPENWQELPQKEKEQITHDIAIGLGAYFAYTATTWHEIITWFGYKCSGIYAEFPSAFTWEDGFSNLLGAYLGAQALRDTEHTFDEAMTSGIDQELKKLGIQPSRVSRRAAKKVRGRWFSGDLLFFINMKKRNFDTGLDDGFVTPSLIPALSECEGAEAQPYPVPNLDFLSEYGFSMKLEIEPRELEKDKILRVVYPDGKERKKRLEPVAHFVSIMDFIKKDAIKKYGHDVDLNSTTSQISFQFSSQEPVKKQLLVNEVGPLEESLWSIEGEKSSIDMGNYGGTPQADMSLSIGDNAADLNNDNVVDMLDMLVLVDMWLEEDALFAKDIK